MIRLSAYNSETEPDKLVRLQAMRALIQYHDRKTFDHIEALHEHKGLLTVVYLKGYFKSIDQMAIKCLWEEAFGELDIEFKEAMFPCSSIGWNESLWGW